MEKSKIETPIEKNSEDSCTDRFCPVHGELRARGRTFKGKVIRKFPKRVCIEFERTLYVQKYERYSKRKTKIHARVPACLENSINLGDYIEVTECRPISKIIHAVVTKKINIGENTK